MKYWIKHLYLVVFLNVLSPDGYSQEVEQKPGSL